jgi:RimJ/RimL family protein N-acetyltransferase
MSRHVDHTGAFEITSLPGQSQVAICHGFFINELQRGRGQGKVLKALQKRALRTLHYDFAVCTVAAGNEAQKKCLESAGWAKLTEFRNRRSSETTEIWGVQP